jgi:50S ribosomal protein L4
MKLKFYGNDFSSCSESDIPGFVSLESDKGVTALKQYLVVFGANLRRRNTCAKDRGNVSGTGKNSYRPNGTGMARHGFKRSPIWAGGEVLFGPKSRDYLQKVNRQVKCLALLRAISDTALERSLSVIDKLTCDEPTTKKYQCLTRKRHLQGVLFYLSMLILAPTLV